MFTGIIEKTGKIKNILKRGNIYRLALDIKKNFDSLKIGDSISVNGVCLTVVDFKNGSIAFDIMEKTFKTTSFSNLKNNDVINLERSLKSDLRFEGHFVLGHIDGKRKIKTIEKNNNPFIEIILNTDDKKMVVPKGSIAIEGMSLTVAEIKKNSIRAYLIPHTMKNTNLKFKRIGDWVNVEFDVFGKYVQNKVNSGKRQDTRLSEKFLAEKGFI